MSTSLYHKSSLYQKVILNYILKYLIRNVSMSIICVSMERIIEEKEEEEERTKEN